MGIYLLNPLCEIIGSNVAADLTEESKLKPSKKYIDERRLFIAGKFLTMAATFYSYVNFNNTATENRNRSLCLIIAAASYLDLYLYNSRLIEFEDIADSIKDETFEILKESLSNIQLAIRLLKDLSNESERNMKQIGLVLEFSVICQYKSGNSKFIYHFMQFIHVSRSKYLIAESGRN